jgi:hypothetical protein
MFKLIAKLAIIAALAHAGVKIVPVFWQYANFKDRLAEAARFSGRTTAEKLTAKANKIAADLEVPLEEPVTVTLNGTLTVIDARYVGQLEYFPRQFYPWDFVIHVEETKRYDAYMP